MLGSTWEFELSRNLNEEDFELRIINALFVLKNLGFQKTLKFVLMNYVEYTALTMQCTVYCKYFE